MTSDEIFDLLERIKEARGNAKIELLKEHADNDQLRAVLMAALNPFIRYGLTSIAKGEGEGVFTDWTVRMLDQLANRQLTGSAAQGTADKEAKRLTPKSAELLQRIIKKDLRCGLAAKSVNKAIPKLIPSFDCMLASKYTEKAVKQWPAHIEPKLDGVRVLGVVVQGSNGVDVTFYSRTGREYPALDHMKEALASVTQAYDRALGDGLGSFVFDGEALSGGFNDTVSSVRKKGEQAKDAVFHIFDMLPLSVFEEQKGSMVLWKRREHLESWFEHVGPGQPFKLVPAYKANSHDEILAFYNSFRSRGLEGVIVKDTGGSYEYKRSKGWLKIKDCQSVDVQVVDAFEGTGKYENRLGGITVDLNSVRVNVGGGFSDAQRKELWHAYQCDRQRCIDGEDGMPVDDFELLNKLVEVEYHEITPDGSLRHPRFVRFRDDKRLEDGPGV